MDKYLVFTDLDGTFLNHDNYSFEDALPAIALLSRLEIPVIFTSSKTAAEIAELSDQVGIDYPVIYETGCGVHWPENYFPHLSGTEHAFCTAYHDVVEALASIRDSFSFRGFNDLGAETVAEITGLSKDQAGLACQRSFGEPVLWEDDESRLDEFVAEISAMDLHVIRGGRFLHVMSPSNKGLAIAWLTSQYRQLHPETDWKTIGLGDSKNDIELLQAVDYPFLVRNLHIQDMQEQITKTLDVQTTQLTGAAGWNEAVSGFISAISDGKR